MKNLLYIVLLTLVFVSCDERLEDLNTDKRNPASVAPESLFARGTREAVDNIVSMSVNDNPFRLYSQMWAQTTYPDESQYTITAREISLGIWTNQYRDVLIDLKDAREIIATQLAEGTSSDSDETLENKMAIIDILSSYTFLTMVDIFGDIPYSEALDPANLSPRYDDAETIYTNIESVLSTAATTLTTGANASASGFGTSDLVYGGNIANWAAFANSVKLRMAMKMADVSGGSATSVTWANEAMAAGVITSNAMNFAMTYQSTSPNSSPLHEDLVLSGRADFVSANTIVDIMNAVNDPRRPIYFRENLGAGVFSGGTYGDANAYANFSQVGDIFHEPETPGVLFNYAEIQFLMAEMYERGGYTIPAAMDLGSAAAHYDMGITASMEQWGVAAADITTYLAQADVAYATADGGSGDWREIIGRQLWLGLYNQGLEGWSTWRRMDFSGFNPPPGMTAANIPVRMTYPLRETTLNGDNYTAAGSAIGGDAVSTRLFWDAN